MRHAYNDFFYPFRGSSSNDRIKACNYGFTSFQRKSLLADVFFIQEALKSYRTIKLVKDSFFLFNTQSI